jgi:hypothetical protein
MNPEIKAQWLADLRSGRFIQAKGALCVRASEGGMPGIASLLSVRWPCCLMLW